MLLILFVVPIAGYGIYLGIKNSKSKSEKKNE